MQTFNINTFAYGTQEQALISIFHKGTTGKFYIKNLEVVPNSPMRNGGAIDIKRYFNRITAVSGGYNLPYRKASLGNADLPSQVGLVRRPDGVTFVANSTMRSLIMCPISIMGLSYRTGGRIGGLGSMTGTSDIWTTSRDTRVQGIILREGEGFAFGSSNPSQPVYPFSFWLTVTLRNTANNQTYHVFTQIAPEEMKESSFAIFNGSGSGITLEIVDMELCDLGDTVTTLPLSASYLRFIRTCGHDGGGMALTPVSNNTADAIPNSLDIRRNYIGDDLNPLYAVAKNGMKITNDLGYPNTNQSLMRKIGTYGTRLPWMGAVGGVGINTFGSPIMAGRYTYGGYNFNKDNSIILEPGDGFAIVQSNYSGYSEFYIEATILYDKTDYTPEEIADAVWTRSGRTLTS